MMRLLSSLVLLFTLSSCDPGFSVILSNQSLTDKNITVKVTRVNKIHYLDSIAIIDSINGLKRVMVGISKDTTANSYTFILQKGKSAVLQQGIGGPDLSEKIIVDLSDTILLSSDRRIIKKRKGISTLVNIQLE